MVSLKDGLVEAVTSGLCNNLNLAAGLGALGSNLWRSAGADGIADRGADLARGFGAAADILCDRTPRDAVAPYNPTFTGGQCVGSLYQVVIDYTSYANQFSCTGPVAAQTVTNNRPGPIQQVYVLDTPGAPTGNYQIRLIDGNGDGVVLTPDCDPRPVSIASVTVQSGPDNCGNGIPYPPPFDPSQFNPTVPVSFDDNTGTPQNINVPVQFGPGELDRDNGFKVPFVLDFGPGIQVNGDINLNTGDFNVGIGGEGGDIEEIPEEEETPSGSVLVGVRVVVTESSAQMSPATQYLASGSSEDLYIPRLAAVRFEYRESAGGGWSDSRFCQSLQSVIWAERPAVDVDVALENNVVATVTKLIMPIERFFSGTS